MFKISDSHNDFISKLPAEKVGSYLYGEIKDNNVEILTAAICTDDKQEGFYTVENLKKLTAPLQNIPHCKILLEFEDIGFLHEKNLNILDEVPPFGVTLTWNNDNSIAGGCRGQGSGITPFGHEVIKLLKNKRIAIDTAHLNRRSFYELLDTSASGNIYNSHTCIADLFTDDIIMERNITAEQIKLIIEQGGFVGITLIPYFLTGRDNCNAEDLFRHIDFVVQKFGCNNIGLGSDFYGAKHYPEGILNYYGYHSIAEIFEKHNYTASNIEKILFSNYNNFCKKFL